MRDIINLIESLNQNSQDKIIGTINGYAVPESQVKGAISMLPSEWTAGEFQTALLKNGVPEREDGRFQDWRARPIAQRVADRLMQRWRKSGKIELLPNRRWRFV